LTIRYKQMGFFVLTETLKARRGSAYGWPHDLSDDEILARLLVLNLERAAGQGRCW
jgi:hypothetical protein